MKSIVVDPNLKTITMVETETFEDALQKAGLVSGEVDWSGIGHTADRKSITLMAYEFGLRPDMDGGKREFAYCRIGRQMYAGNLLIFASDEHGENADMEPYELEKLKELIEWLPTKEDCEAAITRGAIDRPHISVNGVIHWQWNIDDGRA